MYRYIYIYIYIHTCMYNIRKKIIQNVILLNMYLLLRRFFFGIFDDILLLFSQLSE